MQLALHRAVRTLAAATALTACHGAARVIPDAAPPHEETAIAIAPPHAIDAAAGASLPVPASDVAMDATSATADHPLTPFLHVAIDAPHLARIFATIPELVRLGSDVRLLDDAGVADVMKRSDGGAPSPGQTVTSFPVLWNPEPGVEILVASGRGDTSSFVVALRQTGEDSYRFAASFVLEGDTTPVILAFDGRTRSELTWTSCYGCRGEEGRVRLGSDHRVVIAQR